MKILKQVLAHLTPLVVVSLALAALAACAAFGLTISVTEQASVVAFVGAGAIIVTKYPTVESIVGLITAGLAVALAFGLPVTAAQSESILVLAGLIATIVLGKGAVNVVAARKAASAKQLADTVSGQVADKISGQIAGASSHKAPRATKGASAGAKY
jgi:hypothetical protein